MTSLQNPSEPMEQAPRSWTRRPKLYMDSARCLASSVDAEMEVAAVRSCLRATTALPLHAGDGAVLVAARQLARRFEFPFEQVFVDWIVSEFPPTTSELAEVVRRTTPTDFGEVRSLETVKVEVHDGRKSDSDVPAELKLIIDRTTTLADIDDAWAKIQKLQDEHLGANREKRRRPPKDIDFLRHIWKALRNGLSISECVHEWHKLNPGKQSEYTGSEKELVARLRHYKFL